MGRQTRELVINKLIEAEVATADVSTLTVAALVRKISDQADLLSVGQRVQGL